jgi:hypothetical protein
LSLSESSTPEWRWLYSALHSKWHPQAQDAFSKINQTINVNWEALAELSDRQRVSPLIYDLAGGTGILPPSIETRFQQIYYLNARRNTRLLAELNAILSGLTQEGVPALVFKGGALAETVYGNIALRPMADLDILISPGDIHMVPSILGDIGYHAYALEPWSGFSLRHRQVLEYHKLCDGDPSSNLDLHWGILDIPFYRFIPIGDLVARAISAQLPEGKLSIPSDEDHLLILCAQFALHERYSDNLIRYCDIAALLAHAGQGFNWDITMRRAQDWHLVIPLQRTLRHTASIWPGVIPEPCLLAAGNLDPTPAERRIHNWVVDRPQNLTTDTLLHISTMPGWGSKIRYSLEQAFPSPAYMRKLYCPRRPYLWPLTYLLRAVLPIRDLFLSS